MGKIIFIDVDGTLVDYDGNIPGSAVKAIRAARANGHRVYISTGRSKAEVYQDIWDIGLDGMIGGNGSYVEDQGQVILHQLISKDQCKRVVDWLHGRGLEFYLESNNGLFASEHFEEQGEPVMQEYSKRKGTRAAAMAGQLLEGIKAGRSQRLLAVEEKLSREYRQGFIGKKVEILIEETTEIGGVLYQVGHTCEYIRVAIQTAEDLSGRIIVAELAGFLPEDQTVLYAVFTEASV